jgi:hypothetical protein
MSTQILAFHAAVATVVARLCKRVTPVSAIALVLALIVAGCTDIPPAPVAGPDASDPGARAPRVDYRSTVGPYRSQRPASADEKAWGEKTWREQNEQVTPAPKSGQ